MNATRRKALSKIIDSLDQFKKIASDLESARGQMETFKDNLVDLKSSIESERDGEQESYDNLSENLQGGEKGQAMSAAIEEMESALTELDEIIDPIDEFINRFDEIDGHIDTAVTALDNAKQ